MKVKAPAMFRPQQSQLDREQVLARFRDFQQGFVSTARAANEVNLSKLKVASPAIRLLRLPLGTWLHVMERHQERHLQQARQRTQDAEFPR